MHLLTTATLSKVLHPADWLSSAQTSGSTRMAVCPPAYFVGAQPIWRGWMRSHWNKWQGSKAQRSFLSAQTDFKQALWDLQSYEANCTREKIQECQCLLDLWHLRPAIFQVIARHRGETQALERMASINQYFHIRMN